MWHTDNLQNLAAYQDLYEGDLYDFLKDLTRRLVKAMSSVCGELQAFRDKCMLVRASKQDIFSEHLFRNIALPMFISEDNERATTRYLSITTIATFFSSITATTLQFSFDQQTSKLWVAVNAFWFMSLVFSIASAANAIFAITWRKSLWYVIVSQKTSR